MLEGIDGCRHEFERISHGSGSRDEDDLLELLALECMSQRGFESIEDKSDAALADHSIEGFRFGHEVRQVSRHSRFIRSEHDIDKLGQTGSEDQQFIARLETHSPDDTCPRLHLLEEGLPADAATEIDQRIMAVMIGQDTLLEELP